MAARLIRRWQKKPPRVVEKVATLEGDAKAITIKAGSESFITAFPDDETTSFNTDSSFLDDLEKKLRGMGVTHCIDLNADDERVPIDLFFKEWKAVLEGMWKEYLG